MWRLYNILRRSKMQQCCHLVIHVSWDRFCFDTIFYFFLKTLTQQRKQSFYWIIGYLYALFRYNGSYNGFHTLIIRCNEIQVDTFFTCRDRLRHSKYTVFIQHMTVHKANQVVPLIERQICDQKKEINK